MINISGDHLGLHGVQTVEGLAEVKGVVLRTTRPDGWVVLNADDPLVRAQAAGLHAPIIWVTQDPENPTVVAHRHAGGRAVIAEDGSMLESAGRGHTRAWSPRGDADHLRRNGEAHDRKRAVRRRRDAGARTGP